jgi:hypothetical protein
MVPLVVVWRGAESGGSASASSESLLT